MTLNATKKGLIAGCIMIALELFFFYVLKQPVNSRYQFASYLLFSIAILWSVSSLKQTEGIKLRDHFSQGFKTFIVITLLMVVYTFVFYTLHPEIRDSQIELNSQLLLQEQKHTGIEIEANAKQMKKIFMPMMLGIKTFSYLLCGALITLLSSVAIMQLKKR